MTQVDHLPLDNKPRQSRPAEDRDLFGAVDSSYLDDPSSVRVDQNGTEFYVFTDPQHQEYRLEKKKFDEGLGAAAVTLSRKIRERSLAEGWSQEQTEEEIVGKVSTLYRAQVGDYDPKMQANFEQLDRLRTAIAANPDSAAAKKAFDEFKVQSDNYYHARDGKDDGIRELDNYPRGTFVCAEDTMQMQILLKKCGVETTAVAGFRDVAAGSSQSGHHMFLVSNATNNIIEATESGRNAYRPRINGSTIQSGPIIVQAGGTEVYTLPQNVAGRNFETARRENHESAVEVLRQYEKDNPSGNSIKEKGEKAFFDKDFKSTDAGTNVLNSKNLTAVICQYSSSKTDTPGVAAADLSSVQRQTSLGLS